MALNVPIQVYRGTRANLAALATTGKAGILAWTTDTNELFVDAGSGSAGIGSGKAWQKVVNTLTTVNAQVGTSYAAADSDRGKLVTLSNASAVAVSIAQAGASNAFPSGWSAFFENLGAGLVTITPTTSTIDGLASITLGQYQSVLIVSDGTNYFTVRGKGSIVATSGVSHQFVTSIAADGTATLAQPAFTDISGTLSQAQLPATIDCGTF